MVFVLLIVTLLLLGYGLLYVSRDYLSPLAIYSYVALLTFVIRPSILAFGLDEFYLPMVLRKDLTDLLEKALSIFILSHVAVLLGYQGLTGTAKRMAQQMPRIGGAISEPRLMIVSTLVTLATFGATLASVLGAGGVSESVVEARSGETSNLVKTIPQASLLFMAVAVLACWVAKRRRAFLYSATLFTILLGLNVPFGDRSALLVPFLLAAVTWHMSGRGFNKAALAGTVGVLLITSAVLGELRGSVLKSQGDFATTEMAELYGREQRGLGRTITGGLNLQIFDYFVVVVQDFDHDNLRWGDDFYTGIVGVVPRALWPNKPTAITPGQWFRERYTPRGSGGKPYTNVGVYWVNFGAFGVFFGFFISGVALRTVTEMIKLDRSIFGSGLLATCTLFLLNAGIAPLIPMLFVRWIGPYILCVAASTVWTRQRAPLAVTSDVVPAIPASGQHLTSRSARLTRES